MTLVPTEDIIEYDLSQSITITEVYEVKGQAPYTR